MTNTWNLEGSNVVRFDGTIVRGCASVDAASELLADLEANLWFEQAKSFNTAQRKKDASSGAALPDGSFPIENTSDLKNAIRAIGRASNPDAAKAHIKKRAAVLGATDMLPDSWK